MPAAQGVLPWPDERKNLVTLADIYNLPFEDYSLDRVMISHCLETAGDPLAFLNEVWRVLAGDGRLLLIVPNRLGLWARFEHTPFGTGQPYTATQLTRLLQQASFTTLSVQRTLYTPPTNSRFWLSSAKVFENMGSHLWAGLSGVLVIEARKDIYAALPARRVVKKPITIPGTTIPIGTPTNRT
jgi:SAM-dependent methyltransferase